MIKIMTTVNPNLNLSEAKLVFPHNFGNETTILQSTLQSLESAAKDNSILENTLEALSKAEKKLFPDQNNRPNYQEELRSIFSGATRNDLQTKLDEILPVFNFLDTVFRINLQSEKILTITGEKSESEINKQAQSLMQKTYKVVEKLPTIIRSSLHKNPRSKVAASIIVSNFYKQFIENFFDKLKRKHRDKPTANTEKIANYCSKLEKSFKNNPTNSNLEAIFNFRYAHMISPSPETVFNSFIKLSEEIDFNEIQTNLPRNPEQKFSKTSKNALKEAHAQVEAIYELYKQTQDVIHSVLKDKPDRILEMKGTTLAFMNQALLEQILKNLSSDNHQRGKSLIESSKSQSLILTSLNLTIDKITNKEKYAKAAETTGYLPQRDNSRRKHQSGKGSRAS